MLNNRDVMIKKICNNLRPFHKNGWVVCFRIHQSLIDNNDALEENRDIINQMNLYFYEISLTKENETFTVSNVSLEMIYEKLMNFKVQLLDEILDKGEE